MAETGRKHVGEKEKLLVLSFISFFCSVFKTCTKKQALFGKGLKALWSKEKMLVSNIFSLAQNVFNPFKNKFQFLKSHLFSPVQRCSSWTGVGEVLTPLFHRYSF